MFQWSSTMPSRNRELSPPQKTSPHHLSPSSSPVNHQSVRIGRPSSIFSRRKWARSASSNIPNPTEIYSVAEESHSHHAALCVICLRDVAKEGTELQCGHTFHSHCIKHAWLPYESSKLDPYLPFMWSPLSTKEEQISLFKAHSIGQERPSIFIQWITICTVRSQFRVYNPTNPLYCSGSRDYSSFASLSSRPWSFTKMRYA